MAQLNLFKRWQNRDTGQFFEDIAHKYLIKQGLRFITANFNCRYGELDLIMADNEVLVFVEVKFRQSQAFGGAVAAVTPAKQRKLIKTAQLYMQQQKLSNSVARFDVIAIQGDASQIRWIQNAFYAV